ncbi:hypothetical protein C8Q77DRAFT_1271337 [Trametes polyzona]|nr:hypothetical protein C8Q77DRAFT_1271337 [Trametes polyzona]
MADTPPRAIDSRRANNHGDGLSSPAVRLPFDIIHILLDFVESVVDLVNFCSTCKPLHVYLKTDSVWRRACAPYGIRDFRYFGGQSAQAVYTQLIHPYGPLLGLWANDHPFYGKILEFSLFPGDAGEQAGIIGEVWTSPSPAPPDSPIPPLYVRAVKISFEGADPRQPPSATNASVRVFCDRGRIPTEPDDPPSRHLSSLVRLSATTLSKFIMFYRRKVNLPDFPPHISPWLDRTRSLPRIPEIPETTDHQREIIKIYPAARLPAVFVAPTKVTKPPAISIRCPLPPDQCPCHALHATALGFANLDTRPPRYYPLRNDILPGVDPASDEWTVASLDGLWYGSYGPSGTECIYLAHYEDRVRVEATKITGDVHVPRGCVSWIVHVPHESQRDRLRGYWTTVRDAEDEEVPRRVFAGHGTIAGEGFTDIAIVDILAGIISEDQIDIFWTEIHEFRTYRRYKGRSKRS